MTRLKKIDLHAHYISPGFAQFLDDYFDGKGDGVPTPPFSVEGYFDFMQENDIDFGVLSISSPHLSTAPDTLLPALTKEVNDYAAQFVSTYPDKLGFFASLPLPLIEESIKTIDTSLDRHHALGFTLPTNIRGVYLGDAQFDAVLSKLNERHATVAIHPNEPQPVNEAIKAHILTPLMEFFFDTTRAIAFMSQNNVFSKYPNIKWIVPHCGALLPIIAQRIDMGNKMFQVEHQPDDMQDVLKHLYFDLAGKVLPYQLPTLLHMVDENKIVYGSDAPYTTKQVVHTLSQALEKTDALSEAQKLKMFYTNAMQLI